MTIPPSSHFFQPVEKSISVEPMEIQVHAPPPWINPNFQGICNAQRLSQDIYTYDDIYPGKTEHFDTQREASQASTVTKISVYTIPRNSAGQRIDPPIHVSQKLVDTVKHEKACKNAYLRRQCRIKQCSHSHGVLEGHEVDALRQHARLSPCRNESTCLDPTYYRDHMCLRGSSCDRSRCLFKQNMHVVDFQGNH